MTSTDTTTPLRLLDTTRSAGAYARAQKVIPGGLVSRIRKRDNQVVFRSGNGPYLWDLDGNTYVDTVLAHGPVLLGHAHPEVNDAVKRSVDDGVQFGATHYREAVLAEKALDFLPWADKVTYMTTGTEAVQLAIRIARTTTGRDLVVKFDGHYHGWIDPVYVNIPGYDPEGFKAAAAGEGPVPAALPVRAAVGGATPPTDVVVTVWGNIEDFRTLMAAIGDQVAGIIFEPFLTGYGTFDPGAAYFQQLKDIAHQHGALVIFDEVVTGFRMSPSGASGLVGVTPDVAAYAKAMANGYPISMVAGTEAVMACVADGRVPAAGTYSGSPASVEAALATLAIIEDEGPAFYDHLDLLGTRLKAGVEAIGRGHGVPLTMNQIGSICQLLWGDIADPASMSGTYASRLDLVPLVCEGMIARGVYTTRKGLFYLSRAHTPDDIDTILRVFEAALLDILSGPGSETV